MTVEGTIRSAGARKKWQVVVLNFFSKVHTSGNWCGTGMTRWSL